MNGTRRAMANRGAMPERDQAGGAEFPNPEKSPTVGISRVRAVAMARAWAARSLIDCDITDVMPTPDRLGYQCRKLPENCWYVTCRPIHPRSTGGSSILLCVSKRSGRVLFETVLHGE